MALNIKNERTCELAAELAEVTGESKTQAITVALEERLEREHKLGKKKATVEEIMALAHEVVHDIGYQPDEDHTALLYDEPGLPK